MVRILAGLLFLVLGLFACDLSLESYGPRSWFFWACGLLMLAFGLLVLVATIGLLASRKPAIVIDSNGLSHALLGSVAWSDVAGMALESRNKGKQVSLTLGLAPGAEIEGGWRWLRAVQRTQALWVQLDGLDQEPDEIFRAAQAARDGVAPPRLEHWHHTMSPRLVAAMLENERLLAEAEEIVRRPKPGPRDEAEALANAERMTANTAEMAEALNADTKALVRKGKQLARAMVAVTVVYALLLLARLVLVFL
jgi:hypothetical protein